MESANLHHQHQLQEQLVGSTSLATPSFYGVGSDHSWNSNLILNDGSFNQNVSGVFSNSRDLRQNNDILISPPLNSSMIQDMGFHWTGNAGSFTNNSANQLHLAKIKEELSDSFPKFSETVTNLDEFHLPSTSYVKNEQQQQHLHDLSEKILLRTLSSGRINALQHSEEELYSDAQSCASLGGIPTSSAASFSRIFPTTNISNKNSSSSPFSSSFGMNLQALDLLTSTRYTGSFSQPSHGNLGMLRDSLSFGLDQLQQSSHKSPYSPNKVSSFSNGVTDTKRQSSLADAKLSQAATKKPRFESRSSFPPFKVRKEKLGDRIAALQQLVSPFGKTLSVPYMKSSRSKTCRTMQGGSGDGERNEEPKRDLRSRGLCLVPLSCTSYVTNDGSGVWPPPPNFGGGT
ncbi:PREDICTED: transcription factor bHLH110-like isoform X2 [Nelumbo nucifera]|uniref:Transcription factor bHLH110-like isoform X2 n=1 Tax=Nelumbo nucifera TaxID=4432 RepID=A0A1U7ZRT9_NELNU|nr:PREDICTED: transcription factor bHLH110-like isoform X2 [Nelumbo nucifera]